MLARSSRYSRDLTISWLRSGLKNDFTAPAIIVKYLCAVMEVVRLQMDIDNIERWVWILICAILIFPALYTGFAYGFSTVNLLGWVLFIIGLVLAYYKVRD